MTTNSSMVASKATRQKVAIYVRVSTHWQIDKDSLPVQKQDLINYASYVLSINDYEIFEDAGYSAKNTNRPRFQEMMSRVRTGEFSHVIVWKLDRISRNLLDFSSMYAELKSLGVVFISRNEQFDTSTAMGEAMLKIILVFAELERQTTSERVKAVMLSRATNGNWNGGRVPFGYDYDKKSGTFSINEKEKNVVTKIFAHYDRTRSLLAVSRDLNEKGIRSKRGELWSPTTVSIVLSNPWYIGSYRYNKFDESAGTRSTKKKDEAEWITVENHHEPIIQEEEFIKVGEILHRNRRNGPVDKVDVRYRKNIHIFAGLIECGECHNMFSCTSSSARKSGWKPSVYGCTSKRKTRTCSGKFVSDSKIGPFMLSYISNMIFAQSKYKPSTSKEALMNRILSGDELDSVESIGAEGLQQMIEIIKAGVNAISYAPPMLEDRNGTKNVQELSILKSEKEKTERAIARLKSMFLFDDDAMPEKDFIIEKKKLSDRLESLDSRIAEIGDSGEENSSESEKEFETKASYFLMVKTLSDSRRTNYKTLLENSDPQVIKDFMNSVIARIIVTDGLVQQIEFKNGMTHTLEYKNT